MIGGTRAFFFELGRRGRGVVRAAGRGVDRRASRSRTSSPCSRINFAARSAAFRASCMLGELASASSLLTRSTTLAIGRRIHA